MEKLYFLYCDGFLFGVATTKRALSKVENLAKKEGKQNISKYCELVHPEVIKMHINK